MFLKAIEIRGFKSFADKTKLDFKKGITAVVGPNGSGKSNISDAVKWVLGEQSVKSLRGGKMEDVIFAGTQFRKPVGLAQVMLTLDNYDGSIPMEYNDVTIGRRLYRSGESEYYINNTRCRLKDVQEMFMDTGIGKEGYSIIGQGKIEAVLSGRPEERRGLLEEAAGIVKFKTRKEDAEKKLQNTEENLTRINDIIGTYEERLEPLKSESEKAKKFIELSSKLKENEINLIVNSSESYKKKINIILKAIESLNTEIQELLNQKNKDAENLRSFNESLNKLEEAYEKQKKQYYENKSEHQSIIGDNGLMKEKIQNSARLVAKAKRELEEINEKRTKLLNDKEENELKLEKLKGKLKEINEYIENMVSNMKSSETEKTKEKEILNNCKNKQFDTLGAISDAKNFMILVKKDIENHELNIAQIKESCDSYLNAIKINENTKTDLEKEIHSIKDKISTYQNTLTENNKETIKINKVFNINGEQLKIKNAELNKLEANRNMLVNLDAQYEGYNKSVKNLMINIKNKQITSAEGNCYVLGEIISVNKGLELAIETALGGAISNIITEDENLAKKLISFLKQKKLGRATFLPLNILKNRSLVLSNNIIDTTGFVGIASNLLSYDKHFAPAIEHILGRTVIAEDMNSALLIARQSNFSFKIVTLEADVVNAGGALSGGSVYNKSVNIIGRKREIEELRSKIEKLKIDIDKLMIENTKHMSKLKVLHEDNLNLVDLVHSENIEITKIEGRINALKSESAKLNNNYKVSMDEVDAINNKFYEASKDLTNEESKVEQLTENEIKLSIKIEELDKKLSSNAEKLVEFNTKLTSAKVEKAKFDEILTGEIRESQRFSKELEDIYTKINQLTNEINTEKNNTNIYMEKINKNSGKISEIKQFLAKMDKIFENSDIEKIQLKNKHLAANDKLEELSLIINSKEEEKHRQELSLTKIETEDGVLIDKLNTEYNLTLAEAFEYKKEIIDSGIIKSIIENCKRDISALGNVNTSAVEEYKEVSEKYEFMSNQRDDLVNSKEEIVSVITDMTAEMRKMFTTNFAKIRENFNQTFRELFKGGSADLILSGEDVLSANIEINVEPPGKKLQNISLMSGGEKGLSAIALLFAILKMKPTPFCILDEIEAALDDANVTRYAEFLKKFSENIQFIVITHRKGTMEASDVLYGITMEEKGISKIVSVDLTSEVV
ncbi:chromosome segregation protein SMC [Clostridium akagii]|uniref:chromosome segregation protein SMC n=1 Tax=Clostridium akagii TaxID=91623 RepID=UPI000478EA0F|nr:chromosome segregation protein SMC [Clostridium akagii]